MKFLKGQAYEATKSERKAAREKWLAKRTDSQAQREGVTSDSDRKRIRHSLERTLTSGVLSGGYELIRQDGERVTVQDLLDDPDEFDKERFTIRPNRITTTIRRWRLHICRKVSHESGHARMAGVCTFWSPTRQPGCTAGAASGC